MRLLWLALVMLPLVPARAADLDCLVNPSVVLKLGSPVASTLDSVSVDRGSIVHKGQEIARIESSVELATVSLRRAAADSVADLNAHRAKYDAAVVEMTRASNQVAGLSVTAQKVAELHTALRVAEQELALAALGRQMAQLEMDRAQAQVQQRIIRSPIDGVVTERALQPGEYVHADAHIVTIAAIDPLYVEAYPPAADYELLTQGERVQVTLDPPIGGTYSAKVITIDKVFDAGTGTFGVRLELPNPDGLLPAGIRCHVMLSRQSHPSQ